MVKLNDWVTIHFTLLLRNGMVYASTQNKDPVCFKVGEKQVFLGIENAVLGMSVGQNKRISLSPKETFGEIDKSLILSFLRSNIPVHIKCELGQKIEISQEGQPPFRGVISNVNEEVVVVDGNFPLTGQYMNLSIEVVDIA